MLKLNDLVGDEDTFFRDYWGKQVALFHGAPLEGLTSEQEMWNNLDCGLLVRPYFTVFKEGVRPAIEEIVTTRSVVGHDMPGYANPAEVKRHFSEGSTYKFNQAEHWHPATRALVENLRHNFRAELEAFIFLSPPDLQAMGAHTDGAHVLVLQIAGRKNWWVGEAGEGSAPGSALSDLDRETCFKTTLEPGDVLYMPHGSPHCATAAGGNSLHLSITIEEPSAKDIVEVMLAGFLASSQAEQLVSGHHLLSSADRVRALADAFQAYLAATPVAETVTRALTRRGVAATS